MALTWDFVIDKGMDYDGLLNAIEKRRVLMEGLKSLKIRKKAAVNEISVKHEFSTNEIEDQVKVIEVMEVTAYLVGLGLCFKCHEEGHMAKDCLRTVPIDRNACFNCGDNRHRWRQCSKKLKPALQKYLEKRRNKGKPQEPRPEPVRGVQPDPYMHELLKRMDMMMARMTPTPVNAVSSETQYVDILSVDPFKEPLFLGEKDQFYSLWNGTKEKIHNAKLDTGATVSICGPSHAKHIREQKYVTPIMVRVADGTVHKVDKRGIVNLEVNGKDIGACEVYLCDVENWQAFLLGRDEIRKKYIV